MWFEDLMGFSEDGGPDDVRSQLVLDGEYLSSRVNGRQFGCGVLAMPNLASLRHRVAAELPEAGTPHHRIREVVADVQALHTDPANTNAVFQVASQFNLLEMVSPRRTPEEGVGIYEYDRTQGPACAIAAGAGTIYRNYFVPVGTRVGQSREHQVDCLADLGALLGNTDETLWSMQNGYVMASSEGLSTVRDRLLAARSEEIDLFRQALRVGVHRNVEVTLDAAGHHVTQVYGSALPVAYHRGPSAPWEPFARLVLEASYEATLLAGALNFALTGCNKVFLTLLGGGAFGNEDPWIFDAIEYALEHAGRAELDIVIVSYGASRPGVRDLIQRVHRT